MSHVFDIGSKERAIPDRTRGLGAVPFMAFALCAIVSVAAIVSNPHLPLVDLPNHIARLHIAAASEGGPLDTYYEYTFGLIPNSAADLVWHLTGFPGEAEEFASVLIAIYAVNLIAATMVVSRVALGRWTTWPAASALLVFSAPFMWGFQNFVFSLPFMLYGLALWLAMEEGRWARWRMPFFILFAAALYIMHFFAFLILGIAAFGREVQRAANGSGPVKRRIGILLIEGIPFVLPIVVLIVSLVSAPESDASTRTEFGILSDRFRAAMSPLVQVGETGFSSMTLISAAAIMVIVGCGLRVFAKGHNRLAVAPRMKGPIIALAVASLLAPTWLNGIALVHIRVPVVLIAVLFASTFWIDLRPRSAIVIAVVLGLLIGGRAWVFHDIAATYSQEVADLREVSRDLPPGARVAGLRGAGHQRDRSYYHVHAHLVAARSAFVPTLFQGTHLLSVRPEWADHAVFIGQAIDYRFLTTPLTEDLAERLPYLENWDQKLTHAIVVDRGPAIDGLVDGLDLVAQEGRFTLYEVRPAIQ
ncbi:hypothetical protein [Jannaschia aquimarina]|uniref:Glycosyltransferase RgtA/B/C/D-like domain-containing protein n=1 Tax=Jannaschia aquimarina TaxID=935700 RepID=A0A0D1EMW0_9RHOB|nr:hypothetical protein [Jannaschia aquimarina]KIT17040.1 hypothetical protein jaqu_12300 [Jannaschia aquimarina]SNS82069.1 hypothetical protein SAMN05421775_102433 [Jannaschia aquimarina]